MCGITVATATDETVRASETLIVLVAPVELLSGIARFGAAAKVLTAFPPPGALITSVTFAVRVIAPLVPVIVTACEPGVAAVVEVTVSVELPPAATGFGANDYVTPEIAGDAESDTLPEKPFCTAVVAV